MKRKNKILKIVILFFIIIIFILLSYLNISKKDNQNENNLNNEIDSNVESDYLEMKNNSVMYNDNSILEELKNEYKITGEDDLYQIETEKDGRKVITVKTSINYKVAFCGMMENRMPSFEELDSVFKENNPTEKGIWIKLEDRQKILEYLNNNKYLNSKYSVNDSGYLEISQSENQTDFDKKIEKLINSDNQYLLNISSKYYMVDTVTGKIVDNPYNDLEEYQTYEYVKDENRMIIFITENANNIMPNDDIFGSIINLLDSIE